MLTNRQYIILENLLKQKNEEYCTGSTLAELLDVSVRTIQKDIKELRDELEQSSVILEAVPNKGYRLAPLGVEQYNQLAFLVRDHIKGEAKKKPNALEVIKWMLETPGYITTQRLADKMFISESKLSKDMRSVREVLGEYGLVLEHKPHYGIQIRGNEENIRRMISATGVISYRMEAASKTLSDIVVQVLSEKRYLISDVVLENLILYIYIMIQRVRNDHIVSLAVGMREIIGSHSLELAGLLVKKIEAAFGDHLPYSEVEYLALYLQAEKHDESEQLITEEIAVIVSGMLDCVREKTGFDFTNDLDLRMSLAMHIKPMMVRIRNNFQLKNPIMSEIVASYPLAYDIALTSAKFLYEQYDIRIPSDEAAYLTVYYALSMEGLGNFQNRKKALIISSQRRGNSLIMRRMFLKKFADRIEQLDFINVSEMTQTDLSLYDVVFTTTMEYDFVPKDIPRINYFISGQDYRIIEDALNGEKKCRYFEDFFVTDMVLIGEEFSDKRILLRRMVEVAVKKYPNLDEKDLLKSILNREESGFTYFELGIAVPHPDQMIKNDETFVVVALLNKGVKWMSGEIAFLVFLVCTKENDTANTQRFFRGLSTIVSNEEILRSLMRARDFDSFYREIRNINNYSKQGE